MMGVFYSLILLGIMVVYMPQNYAQNLVLAGGNVVVERETFLVIQGDFDIKNEFSDGKIDLDGTILLGGDISNHTNSGVFINHELIPNGWVKMHNLSTIQNVSGIYPISFENLSFFGSQKILNDNNSSTSGFLILNSIFNLNKNNFIIKNNNNSALEYHSGYLFAETNSLEGIGSLEWKISNKIGLYHIPFGTGNTDTSDIPIRFVVNSPGNNNGSVLFSTYHTENSNFPYPDNVISLEPFQPLKIVDRFWIIDADSYSQKPLSTFTLSYSESDINNGNDILKNSLKPISYKLYSSIWSDYSSYTNNVENNSISIQNIHSNNFDKYWTLTSEETLADIFFPNTFSPDLDGDNEIFKPVINFVPKNFEMYIYNRWGNLLFTSYDPNQGWNGTFNEQPCEIGTYVWVVVLNKPDGKKFKYKGLVNIFK